MIDRLPGPRWRRRALALVVAIVAALVLAPAEPASAHATLIATDPGEGAVLEAAPDRIRFTFDESVAGVPDGVHVFDAAGGAVAASAAVDGKELGVTLTDEVGDGTLVVVWRVVSEDGHPISGSLTFSIGAPSPDVAPPPTDSSSTNDAPWTLSVVRWVGYLGLFMAGGLVGFALLFLPPSKPADRARRRLVVVARAGAATAAVAWLVGLPLTAAYQLGGGASSLTKGATWSAMPAAEYAVVAVVVAGVVLAVGLLGRGLPPRPRAVAALVAAVVAVCAPAITGHTRAVTPEALAVGADMLHLLAGSVWLGGLVALALVLPDLSGRGAMAAEVLARFSTVAAGILVALSATGVLLAWRIVGSWSALFDTGYGALLLVKIGVALVAVLIAAWNRYALLPRLHESTHRRDRRVGARVVVRAIAAEAAVLVAVLLVTGLLVDRSPEPDALGRRPCCRRAGRPDRDAG